MSINLLYVMFVISIQASFTLNSDEITDDHIFNIAIFFVFLDAFINCNTGFYKKGYLCTDKYKILKKYYHCELIYDIIALFPLLLLKTISQKSWNYQFLYLPIVFKFNKIPKTLSIIEQKHILRPHVRNLFCLFNLFFNILLIAHSCACFWVLSANISSRYLNLKSWINVRGLSNSQW